MRISAGSAAAFASLVASPAAAVPTNCGEECPRVAGLREAPSSGPAFPAGEPRPPPIHIDYATYAVAVTADVLAAPGAICGDKTIPCIIGTGGGLVLRGGYRSAGPWYFGGAYQFSKTDSDNLYLLATLQQLRAETRYVFDLGYRWRPYVHGGLGGVMYGNEFGAETAGASLFFGIGGELEVSRLALVGLSAVYQPVLLAGFTDTANFDRPAGVSHFVRIELQFEIRSELSRF